MTKETLPSQTECPGDIPPELQSLVRQVIKDNPLARNLSDEEVFTLTVEAIRSEKVNDSIWLSDRIRFIEENSPHIPGSKIPKIAVSKPLLKPSQAQFEAIADQHDRWRDSVLHPTKAIQSGRANFENSDLSGLKIENRDLRGANFRGANLSETQVSNCNLSTCNLNQSTIQNSYWSKVSLKRVDLSLGDLAGSEFNDVDLRGAKLDQIKIDNCQFVGDVKGGELLPVTLARSESKPIDKSISQDQKNSKIPQ